MRFRVLTVLALLVSCLPALGQQPPPTGVSSYLVTGNGRVFRILQVGPVIGAGGKKLGTMISYASETRAVAKIRADAEALVAALGPEMQLAGETSLIVQANVGYDPRKVVSRSVAYNVVFDREADRWSPLPPGEREPRELEGPAASLAPPEDPSFPFDRGRVDAAARTAATWTGILDRGDADASLDAMARSFRSELAPAEWKALVAQRRAAAAGAARRELYRMQTRTPAGTAAAVVLYELRPASGPRVLERVALETEGGAWRPVGYAIQRMPAG